jgi:hypothetical protein
MDFADRMVALETRLLMRFGANGQLIGQSTVYDPATNRMVEVTPARRTVRMTLGPAETLDEEGREVWRNVAKMQIKPERGDSIVFAGTTYTVGNVQTLYEGAKPVLYVAEVTS